MGIKLSLWRHIAASHSRSSTYSHSSTNGSRDQDNVKNYSEIIYKGEDHAFDNDDPRLVVLPVYIPSGVYSLRNTNLLHVQFFIQVSLLASMSKALTVELPLYITHASSWSDPPPRIPRDFIFPVHEDEPVKKHKTGVFAKKRPSSIVNQTSSGVMSPRKQPSSITSSSAPTSKSGTPRLAAAETPLTDGNGSLPITRRSPLKDPDSPTSVLDFSQAGNLFVVNPDSGSFTGSDAGSLFRHPISAWSSPIVHSHEISESPVSSRPSSPLDRSAPLVLDEQELKDEDHSTQAAIDDEDFDMSRSVNPQICPSKKDQEKSKHGKMGLRKTLAKLSISIPTHGTGVCSSHGNSSKPSPRVLPTTPRSTKSQLNSSDEMSADSRSPGAGDSLSRHSSTSSLGSFNSRFDKFNRKSSVGSTRVMTVSPGPVSPGNGQLRSISSLAKSAPTSMPNSATASANASEASSPLTQSGLSSSDSTEDQSLQEKKRDIVHLSMTVAIPDVLVHHGTPQEDTGRDGYFKDNKDQGRSTTPSPSDHGADQYQSVPSTPSSPRQPWQLQRNFSTSGVASSLLESHETPQTARGIRDEFYFGKGAQSRNASTDSFVTRVAPAQTGIPTQEHAIYTTDGKIYDEPLTTTLIDPPAPLPPPPPQAQPILYTETPAKTMNTTEQSTTLPQQQQEQLQQQVLQGGIPRQASWTSSNQYEDGSNCQGLHTPSSTVPMNSSNTPPTRVSSHQSSRVTSRQSSPAQRTVVPTGLMLTPVQSPEGYYDDVHIMAYPTSVNAPEWTEAPSLTNTATQLNIDPNTLGLSGVAPIQYVSQPNPSSLSQDPTYADQGQSYVPVSQMITPTQYQTPQMVVQNQVLGQHVHQLQAPSIHVPRIPQIQHVVAEVPYTQEIYSTPMMPSDESTMRPEQVFFVRTPEAATPSESKSMHAASQAVVSLSSAYQPDPSRLSPNDMGIGADGPLLTGSYYRSVPSSPSYPVDSTFQQVVSPQPPAMAEQLQYANHALQNTLYKDDVRAQPYQPQTQYSPNSGTTWNLKPKSQVVSPQPPESGYYTGTEQQLYAQQDQSGKQTPDRQQRQQLEEQQRLEALQQAQDQLFLREQAQLQDQGRLHEQIRLREQAILQEQQRQQEQRILNEQQRLQEQLVLQQQQQQQQLQLQQQQDGERRLQEQLRQQQQQQQLQQHQTEIKLQHQQLGLQYQQQQEYYQRQHQKPLQPQQQLQPAFQVSEVAMVHQPVVSTPQPPQQSWDYQSPMSISANQPVIVPQHHSPDPMGAMYHQQQQIPYAVNKLTQGYTFSPSQHSPSQLSPSQRSPQSQSQSQSQSHPSSRGHSQPQSRSHSRPQSPSAALKVQHSQPDISEELPVMTNYVYEGKMELLESEPTPSAPQHGLESAPGTREHYTGVAIHMTSPLGYSGSPPRTTFAGLSVMNPDQ